MRIKELYRESEKRNKQEERITERERGKIKQGRQLDIGVEHWMTDVIEVLIWNP